MSMNKTEWIHKALEEFISEEQAEERLWRWFLLKLESASIEAERGPDWSEDLADEVHAAAALLEAHRDLVDRTPEVVGIISDLAT